MRSPTTQSTPAIAEPKDLALTQRASAALPQQALLIVGQLVASKTAQGALDHRDGYQRIKSTLNTLQSTLALEGGAHG